jgi:hypothetical protein
VIRKAALLCGLLAAANVVLLGLVPRHAPIRTEDRAHGLLRAVADITWLKAVSRLSSSTKVTPSEAVRNFHLIRLAGLLNPRNTEPYVYGSVALCMFKRSDLAIDLIREGLAHKPDDRKIRHALFGVVTVFGGSLDKAMEIVPDLMEGDTDVARSDWKFEAHEMLSLFWILKANQLEEEGRYRESLEIWRMVQSEYSYNEALAKSAEVVIKRLEEKL